jgi:preprotein translocase subunit SecG
MGNIWMNLVLALQLLAALAIIGLVLLQHGKGADMGASFGSGSSGSLFGATGSANFLSRSTAVAATLFFVATLALAYFGNPGGARSAASGGSSVLERTAPASAPAASAPAGAAIPSAPTAIPASPAPSASPASAPAATPSAPPASAAIPK